MKERILIIEDNENVRETLRLALDGQEYQFEEASGGPEALGRLEEFRPHLITCDVLMRGGVLPFLGELQKLPEPPLVIIITGPESRELAVLGLRGGAHDYIVRPLMPVEVSARVNSALERRRAHEKMHLQLVQADKMAALGRLVAGVAHEINTPVGALSSNSDSLQRVASSLQEMVGVLPQHEREQWSASLEALTSLADVDRIACDRLTALVRNLKNFARLDEAEKKLADLHEGLDSTLRLVQYDWKDRICVQKDYGKLPLIECYPNQLNQVFLNLLVNAFEAIDGKGAIRIRTKLEGHNVVIQISDSGAGITQEDLPKIFDPGFTTKGVGVGTGLGLPIAYQIIQNHRGVILADSEPGKGTTFTIILPAS